MNSVSLEKVIYWSHSVTVTGGSPSGLTTVEHAENVVGVNSVEHPSVPEIKCAASVPSVAAPDWLLCRLTLVAKTVDPPPGSLTVAEVVWKFAFCVEPLPKLWLEGHIVATGVKEVVRLPNAGALDVTCC